MSRTPAARAAVTMPGAGAGRATTAVASLLAAALALPACSDEPIDESARTARLGVYVEQVVKAGGQGVGFAVSEEGTAARAVSGTSSSVDGATSAMQAVAPMAPMARAGMPTPMMRALVGPRLTQQLGAAAAVMPSMMTAEEQFDEVGAELRRAFDERLFVPSNFEAREGDTSYYRLRADPTCLPLPAEDDPPGTVPQIDPDCAEQLDKVVVRLALRDDGDGGRITVLVGPDRLELVVFVVHSDLLALEIDLAKAKTAAEYVQRQVEEPGAPATAETFQRFAGKVGLSLKKVGERKVTGAVSILAALDIATVADSADPLELRSAVADPLLSFTGDGVNKIAEVRFGLGQTDVATRWDPMGVGAVNRDLTFSLGGYYGAVVIDENAKRIDLTDVGFGQTRVSVRGLPIVAVDLNSASARRFSGRITVNTDDTPRIELRPQFDLDVTLDYAAVAAELSAAPDPILLHDTYGVLLEAPGGTVVVDAVKSSATFDGGLKVVTGTLTLSAASAPAELVTVPAGRCLTSQSPVPAGANPFLGAFRAIDCP